MLGIPLVKGLGFVLTRTECGGLTGDLLFSLGRAWDSLTPLVGVSSVILIEQSLSR